VSLFALAGFEDSFQLASGFSLLEVTLGTQIEVFRSYFEQPLRLHSHHCPNVVARSQQELVVHHPFGFRVHYSRGVDEHYLIVLQGHVMAGSLEQSYLHEEATEDGLLDVGVVLRVGGGAGVKTDLLLAHDADELLADAVGLLEGTEV